MSTRVLSRRDIVAILGAGALCGPVATHAQQLGAKRRIGVLMNLAVGDQEGQARYAAFREALQKFGWTEGRNVLIDSRWGGGDVQSLRRYAAELVALSPDVLLAGGGATVEPLRQHARTTPIVFTNTNDPIALGYVASLPRPGGNITGFINIEYGISGKWLELLKQIAPSLTHAAIIWDSSFSGGKTQLGEIERVASVLQLRLSPIDLRDPRHLESDIAAFSREPNGGLVVTASTSATLHRKEVISLAARYRIPAVYSNRLYVFDGGLLSYGPDFLDQYRRAADYVDRILKGVKPADLPVQAPVIYEVVLNNKTANDLDLKVPSIILLQAKEVLD
jgi:putative tryptophan/tyrosine transport system substrate-binding protein